ncbi:MAG: hypothetical protein DMD48_13990 [Gemmatimonadetes bacterium]|nr:MAG: hypothetical protein DMD48_13990 [Gemmatimonadota bacterium]
MGVGRAVRRPEQRRAARSRRGERLHLGRLDARLLVRDVQDRRRPGQHLRGREELAADRRREPVGVRALARAAEHRFGRVRGCCRGGVGTRSNRSAIGAEVTVELGSARQRQVVDGGMGFCSQNDRRLHFGLGNQRLGRVTIRWPSGTEQVLAGLAIDQLHVITEPY